MNEHDRYDSLLQWYATVQSLDWKLLKRQMLAESSGNPSAMSAAGAAGLFQFMPRTWQEVSPGGDKFNPEHSIRAGAAYMRTLLRTFGNDYAKALASYNWGQGHVRSAVERLGGMWRTALPAETTAYLARILPTSCT